MDGRLEEKESVIVGGSLMIISVILLTATLFTQLPLFTTTIASLILVVGTVLVGFSNGNGV